MVSPFLWLLAGMAAPKFYEKFSPEQKDEWKKKYPMHHGEVGVLMILGGVLSKNAGLAAFGTGLAIEDWKDRDEWFKKSPDENDEDDE